MTAVRKSAARALSKLLPMANRDTLQNYEDTLLPLVRILVSYQQSIQKWMAHKKPAEVEDADGNVTAIGCHQAVASEAGGAAAAAAVDAAVADELHPRQSANGQGQGDAAQPHVRVQVVRGWHTTRHSTRCRSADR